MQPAEKTKAAFLARAQALRDQAVNEGDQAYGAVVVSKGVIIGEGRTRIDELMPWAPAFKSADTAEQERSAA